MVTRNPNLICSILVVTVVAAVVFPQKPGVHQALYSKQNMIAVTTDRLVVVDTPTQFLEIQFCGRYPKSSTDAQARTTIGLFSRSLAPLYQKDDDRELRLIVDEEDGDLGLMTYFSAQEIEDPVRDIYPLPGPYNLTHRIPTPATARIKTKNPGKLLVAEKMTATSFLSVGQVNKIASAKTLKFTLGPTTLSLNDGQRSILLEFARRVNLHDLSAPTVDSESTTDDSSTLRTFDSNASLEETLERLKRQMAISGRVITPRGSRVKYELVESSGCTVTIVLDGNRTLQPYELTIYAPTLNFTANLAYLDPERIGIDDSQLNSRIWLRVLNGDQYIETYSQLGGTGKQFNMRKLAVASFDLRKDGSASIVRDTLVHAIKLCQFPQAFPIVQETSRASGISLRKR